MMCLGPKGISTMARVMGFVCMQFIFFAIAVGGDTNAKLTCEARMKEALPNVENLMNMARGIVDEEKCTGRARAVVEVCRDILGEAIGYLDLSIQKMQIFRDGSLYDGSSDDIWTWMSAVLTFHSTCSDEIQSANSLDLQDLHSRVQTVHSQIDDSLALFTSMRHLFLSQSIHGRKLLSLNPPFSYPLHLDLPTWMPSERRRQLLQTISPDIVVALDGTGSFTSIQTAVNAASPGNVIYVKSGIYSETVVVSSSKSNLVIMGDGIGKTIITGSKYQAKTGSLYTTPTVSIKAGGFIGKYLTIRNTAGPGREQAVALSVSSDKVAFYKCSFDAYQDTLLTFTNRQFYSECQILGTVDFIFGNAAAVFQQCSIYAKSPLGGQEDAITAQGRESKNQNTGFSFESCYVDGATSRTYLGRPWKDYSTTVFIKSQLSNAINPAGWLQWPGASYRSKSVFYGEYQNTGAGADRSKRVSWSKELSMDEASQFTVGSFIGGNQWLGVPA